MALISAGRRRRRRGAILAALTFAALTAQPAGAQSATVAMRGTAFVPATVRVQQVAGEPGFPAAHGHAIWTNEDQGVEHTVNFDDPRLTSSGRVATGQRFEAVLTVAGSFTYRCVIHPSMTGTVEVVSAPAPPAITEGPPIDVDEGSTALITLVLVGAGLAAAAVLAWLLLRRRRTADTGSAER